MVLDNESEREKCLTDWQPTDPWSKGLICCEKESGVNPSIALLSH